MKSLNSMVAQIGFIGRDIRDNIAEISRFSHFEITAEDEKNPERGSNPKRAIRQSGTTRRKSAFRLSSASSQKTVQFQIKTTMRPCREYFSKLDLVRNEKVSKMKKLLESIGPILIKLESLILGTFTGESAKMKQYYVYWEKEIFSLLIS